MDNFFSSHSLSADVHISGINCCGAVRQNRKGKLRVFHNKTVKFKWGDTYARVRGNVTAMIWTDKQDMYTLTSMHRLPTEGNFCDKHGKAQKPVTVEDYNQHMGYINNGTEWLIAIHLVGEQGNGKKKNCLYLTDLTILNSYIIPSSCGSKMGHRKCCVILVQNLLEMSVREPTQNQTQEEDQTHKPLK
jgi:hypothetical protein